MHNNTSLATTSKGFPVRATSASTSGTRSRENIGKKLVIDAEAIAMAQRLLRGIATPTETLATAMFAQTGVKGEFLKLKDTRRLFPQEQHLPSKVIDRGSMRAWQEGGSLDAFGRAKVRVNELLNGYQRPELTTDVERELLALMQREAKATGLEELPGV